jgi:hypothetical protein
MALIELRELTGGGRVHSLSGQERGVEARGKFNLDDLDKSAEQVTVDVPNDLDAISPSFIQGMFAKSLVEVFDRDQDRFLEHYAFRAPTHVLAQIHRGLMAVLTRRPGQVRA